MMRNRLTTLALATAMALPAAAHAYSNFYFFGDSLSDVGAFGGQSGLPSGARWTTGYGPNWTNILTGHYGLSSVANNPLNSSTSRSGNNYAQGGAVAQTYQSITQFPGTSGSSGSVEQYGPGGSLAIQELPQQVQYYLSQTGGKADPNAVYSVWIGGNDVIAAVGTASGTSGTQLIGTSAQYAAAQVQALQQAGAKTIIVPNLPNMAAAPLAVYMSLVAVQQQINKLAGVTVVTDTQVNTAWVVAWSVLASQGSSSATSAALVQAALTAANTSLTAQNAAVPSGSVVTAYNGDGTATNPGISPSLQQLSAGYNQLLDMSLQSSGLQHNIVRPNIATLFQEILANPTRYGFTSVVGSDCYTSAIQCTSSLSSQNNVFSDQLHPTPAANKIIGDYVYGLLQAPYFAAAIPESSLNNARQLGGALDARYQAIRSQKRAVGTVSAFADGAFSVDKASYGGMSAKPKGQLYTVGLDFQATPALSVGMAMSRQQGKTDVDSVGTPGSIDDRTTLMSGFASYNQDKFWMDGDLHIGSGDLDTHRNVTLGPTTVGIDGKTRATQFGLRAAGGYRMQYRGVTTGPVAGLDYAYAKIAGFAEQGGNSSSMNFSSQNVSSLVGRVGWQLDAEVGRFSPYAKVSFAHEFKQNDRNVTAGLATTVGDWTTNLGKPDANWMEWTAGVSANFNKTITAFGQLTATSGKNGGNQTGGNIGVAMSF
ncbi:autotransporter outer membrane beta-barrel domain-containing protein [Chromobacterium piscinae]|uniref:autotransporter outer membrane beta-barrel domain-containing protein n=1 Tax=Chromobacterium piscinae TaxID=686831 RepID=UPI003F7F036F